jgi:hypothetical protein
MSPTQKRQTLLEALLRDGFPLGYPTPDLLKVENKTRMAIMVEAVTLHSEKLYSLYT